MCEDCLNDIIPTADTTDTKACVQINTLCLFRTYSARPRDIFPTPLPHDNHNFPQVLNSYDERGGGQFELGCDLFCSTPTLIICHGRHQQPFSSKPVKSRVGRRVCPHLERRRVCLHLLAHCSDLSGTPGTGFAWDQQLSCCWDIKYAVITFRRVIEMFIAIPHPSTSFTIICM